MRYGHRRLRGKFATLAVLAAALAIALLVATPAYAGNVCGTVTDASTGHPISGAIVHAQGTLVGGGWASVQTTTTADGSYVLDRDLTYALLTVKAGGYVEHEDEVWAPWGEPLRADVALEPADVMGFGVVTDAVTGDPLINCFVTLYYTWMIEYPSWSAVQTVFTDFDGMYAFDESFWGDGYYKVVASRVGYTASESAVVQREGLSPLRTDFSLHPASPVATGVIRQSGTNAPIAGAMVDAYVEREFGYEHVAWSAGSAADGRYEVWDIMGGRAGRYRFEARANGCQSVTRYENWDGATTLHMDFDLFRPSTVFATGTVKDFVTRAPIADAAIWVRGDGSTIGRTGPDGSFTLDNWTVNGPGFYSFDVSARGYHTRTYTFEWDGLAPIRLDAILGDPAKIASGTVWFTDYNGSVVPDNGGTRISAYRKAEDGSWLLAGEAVTDYRAGYTVSDEQRRGAGEYKLVVHSEYDGDMTSYVTWDGFTALSASFTFGRPQAGHLPPVLSIAGADRFATAVAASTAAYPDGLSEAGSRTVVIASARAWPDALSAASLAGALDGPVLLVEPGSIPPQVAEEIVRLGARKAVLVGGETAVGAEVEASLRAVLGGASVERIAGRDRYRTAEAVAARTIALRGEDFDGTAFVATGGSFPDAVAAAPLAAANRWPLYLVPPGDDGVPATTIAAMGEIDSAVVLGGTAAVGEQAERDLRASLGSGSVTRLAGDDRYETAVIVATYGVESGGLAWGRVGLTTGLDYPDALAGGVMLGKAGGVMLLTRSDVLPPPTRMTLAAHKTVIANVTYFGGPGAIGQAARDAASRALQ